MIGFVQRRVGRRIATIIGAAMALAGIGGLLSLVAEGGRAQLAAEQRLSQAMARTIAASFQSFDPRLGQHPVGDINAVLAEQEEILVLEVFDHAGKVRWARDPGRAGHTVGAEILKATFSSSTADGVVGRLERNAVVYPLRRTASCLPCHSKSADPIGGIYLATSHKKLFGADSFPWLGTLGVLLLVAIVTALLLVLLDRLVVDRLGRLVEVMAKAEEGDFMVRAEVRSNDEIGLLASTFNKLLAKITDLRVERIDKEREMSVVLGELSLKQELAKKGELLEAANLRLNARLQQLSFLYDLGRDLASQLELDQLLDRLADLVHDSMRVPEMVVLLADRSKGQLVVAKARGFSAEGDLVAAPFDTARGVTGECARNRLPLYIANLGADRREVPFRSRAPLQGSLLCVPVVYQDELVGLLAYSSPVIEAFSEEERELFTAVGNQAALAVSNAQLFQKTLALSNTDGLTGILNRRAMEARLDLEWSRAVRDGASLSVVMIDIDHFKVYNDQHGHQLGDETLRRVARILERSVRKVDAVARYGGEEFVVILPRANRKEALEVANKLRRSVEQSDFVQGYMQPLGRVTISCGVASAPEDADSIGGLVAAADEALFRAKQSGRNSVLGTERRGRSGITAPPGTSEDLPSDADTWNDDSIYS